MASKQELKNKADSLKALLASLGRNRQEFKNIMDSTPVDSPAYLAALKKFNATKPEFNEATTKYEAAQTAYDNFVQTQKDTQVASKAKNLLQQKKDEIKRAEDYNASAAYIEQLKNDLTTLQQQAQGKGSTVVEEEDSSVYVSDPNALAAYFGSAKVSQGSSGPTVQVTEPNATDPQGNPVTFPGILYTESSKDGADKGVRFLTSDDAVDKYKKQLLKLYGSKQGLVNKLYEARFLDSNKINSKTIDSQITAALNSAVQLYTVKQTDAVNTYGAKEVETLDEFLVPGANVGNTRTESRAVVFDDTNADNLTINVFKAIFGMEPTEKQKKQARPFIQEWQRSKPQVTTTTTSGEGNQQNVVVNTAGDAERMLIDELAQTDQAKASKVLDLYDVFKNTIGVQ